MLSPEFKVGFMEAVELPTEDRLEQCLSLLQENPVPLISGIEQLAKATRLSPTSLLKIAVLFCHVAYVEPLSMVSVLDKTTEAWLKGREELLEEISSLQLKAQTTIPSDLQDFFWQQLLTPPDFNKLIGTFATYNSLLDEALKAAYTKGMSARPGIAEAFHSGYLRPTMEIDSLRQYPEGSLGHAFNQHMTTNNLQLDFARGDQPGSISQLADYVALRILQTHDLWHVVMGYTTNGGDELALLGFQSAQLGTTFSTHVLALAVTQTTLLKPERLLPLMTTIAQGWQQGRQTVPLLPIRWEEKWDASLIELREVYQIQPRQPYP